MIRTLAWSIAPAALIALLVASETARMVLAFGAVKFVLAVFP